MEERQLERFLNKLCILETDTDSGYAKGIVIDVSNQVVVLKNKEGKNTVISIDAVLKIREC